MPSKASPCAKLLYVQRPVFYREAHAGLYSMAVPPEIKGELSLEAQASITVTGGTISAVDGDLALPWLGELADFFAIGKLSLKSIHRYAHRAGRLRMTS